MAPASSPEGRGAGDCPPRAPRPLREVSEEEALEQVRAQVAALEEKLLAITGTPHPFGDEVGAAFRPARVQEVVEALAAEAGMDILQLDCSEYPCLLRARMQPEADCQEAAALLGERGYPDTQRCGWDLDGPTLTRVLADPAVPAEEVRVRYRLRELQDAEG